MELGHWNYDLKTKDGMVYAKKGTHFDGPNGCSLRPNGPLLQEVIRTFRGKKYSEGKVY
jgi:hypothetical protein